MVSLHASLFYPGTPQLHNSGNTRKKLSNVTGHTSWTVIKKFLILGRVIRAAADISCPSEVAESLSLYFIVYILISIILSTKYVGYYLKTMALVKYVTS